MLMFYSGSLTTCPSPGVMRWRAGWSTVIPASPSAVLSPRRASRRTPVSPEWVIINNNYEFLLIEKKATWRHYLLALKELRIMNTLRVNNQSPKLSNYVARPCYGDGNYLVFAFQLVTCCQNYIIRETLNEEWFQNCCYRWNLTSPRRTTCLTTWILPSPTIAPLTRSGTPGWALTGAALSRPSSYREGKLSSSYGRLTYL